MGNEYFLIYLIRNVVSVTDLTNNAANVIGRDRTRLEGMNC